jgi:short-subunit dehydrogenase
MTATFLNKSVVVTGASSGIGKALALRLADERAWLALAARNAERLEALAVECRQRGAKAIAVPTDVACETQCKTLVDRTCGEYGRLDMLINNAGIAVASRLEDLPDLHLFKEVVDVNFYGMVYCTYHALPHLRETKGQIVNVSSLGGKLAIPFNTSYVASKFAMIGFSDSLRMELARAGVSLTVICPYWVVTEFHERFMDKDGRPRGPAGRGIYTEKTMTADRCAQIILAAARRRKREIVMRPGPLALWLHLVAPDLVDRLTVKMILEPAIKRTLKGRSQAPLE